MLNVDKKTPLMRIKDLVYDDHNHPLHIMQEIIRSDKFTYAVNH
ncbi:UTRA domain-containing protein [Lactobacillus kullabergensis]|nr:UTRA domain-containing protein [Lactobacillus kullabergensis]